MTKQLNRRSFLKKAGSTALGATALTLSRPVLDAETESAVSFLSAWPRDVTRPWPGPEFWANPLQDWRVDEGRLECITAGGDRNVALLTREVAQRSGSFCIEILRDLGSLGRMTDIRIAHDIGMVLSYSAL